MLSQAPRSLLIKLMVSGIQLNRLVVSVSRINSNRPNPPGRVGSMTGQHFGFLRVV